MRRLIVLSMTVAGAWLSGCVSNHDGMVLDPVGPAPVQISASNSANGALVVYSAYEVNADFNARDPRRPEYSDYRIFTADGNLH